MLKAITGKRIQNISNHNLEELIYGYAHIVVDVGCGDGKFIYNLARKNPDQFFVGIDSSINLLEDISSKIYKKESRGGIKNIVFIQAAIEDISPELAGIASEIYINFPWGSLLSGIVNVEDAIIRNIICLCKRSIVVPLHVYLTYHESFEPSFVEEKELPALSIDFLNGSWKGKLREYGITVTKITNIENTDAKNLTSWSKKILSQRNRAVFQIESIIN